jgi:hypothetical protein
MFVSRLIIILIIIVLKIASFSIKDILPKKFVIIILLYREVNHAVIFEVRGFV